VRTRSQIQQEFINKIESLKNDKEEISTKLHNKKRELRDLEQAFLKQTCIHDKEKQTLNEKITLFESKKKEMMEYYNNAIELINQEAIGIREDFEKELSEKDAKLEYFNIKSAELEKENFNILTNKTTMKSKVGNLESQLEENKKFVSEVQIKFDNILNNHISKSNAEKEKLKEEYELKMSEIQQHYENLINEMREEFEKTMYEMRRENEDLEEELNELSRKTQANMKASDPKIISEKITDLLAKQSSLKRELESVKLEKEKKIAEISSNFEREKELLNLKVLDLQLALKEYEQLGLVKSISNSKNSMSTAFNNNHNNISNNNRNNFIELEKEKRKWNGERDSLKRNVGELNNKIEKFENKIETLLRENETLKLTYLEDHHSPIHHYRGNNAGGSNNSFIKKNSRSNSIIGAMNNLENNINNNFNNLNAHANNNNNLNNKNSYTLNMQMNMSSPIGKQEPNLFSDNSEIGEYNICYDIASPQVNNINISADKKDYFNANNENKNYGKFGNGSLLGNHASSSKKIRK
jgi:DNA repair exonuclease SbcCD ATPase subunit